MKKLKTPLLTAIVAACSFLTAYAVTPDEVYCDTPSQMFGSSACTDAEGNVKICKHTFWIAHSCTNHYGPIPEEVVDEVQP